ncbi:MAG: metallophosphoesterase [Candidatus Hodarchaeales archaeon]
MDRTKLIKLFLDQNFNITADALDYIQQKEVSERILREKIRKIPPEIPVINLSSVEKYLEPFNSSLQLIKEKNMGEISKPTQLSNENDRIDEVVKEEITKSLVQPEKHQGERETTLSVLHPSSRVVVKLDIPETSTKPDFSAFRQLFQNRFEQLSNIFMENFKGYEAILKRRLGEEEISRVKSGILIGMVQDTRVLHTNKFVIQLEDPKSEIITNCVMVQDSPSFPEYRDIIRDTVIGISGVLPKNFREGDVTAFWGKDVIRPGFSPIQFNPTSDPHKILFIADLHFGSKYFSRSVFAKLVKLLTSQDLDPIYKKIAKEIKTIIIAGDLVDGIGRFSEQKGQISFHSFQAQYEGLATALMEIPSHIQIIIIPGEHDATQAALPQPAIDRQISQALLAIPNLTSHGNPLRLSLEDMSLLVFHGQGNYELFQKQFQKAHSTPTLAIKHLLEYRHLYPEYGSYNPLAPFKRDYLVIDEIPDVIVSGHLHHAYFEEYKGIKIITCGTFQRDNQRKAQLEEKASIGIVPILDTVSGNVEMIDLKIL